MNVTKTSGRKWKSLILTAVLLAGLTACGTAKSAEKDAASSSAAASSAAQTSASLSEETASASSGKAAGASSAGETSGAVSEASSEAASAASSEAASVAASEASSEAAVSSEKGGRHHIKITVENYGDILLELDSEQAPLTVENFMKLAESGFYNGLTFHRIIDGFMIQGGDPLGNGTGGSEQTIKGEFRENGVDNTISHKKGVISMARSADPDSASSQFFITVADSEFLDGQYAAFGYVTEGQDVCDKIAADAEPTDNNGTIPKEKQPVITKIEVID